MAPPKKPKFTSGGKNTQSEQISFSSSIVRVSPPSPEKVFAWTDSFETSQRREGFMIIPGTHRERARFFNRYQIARMATFKPGIINYLNGLTTTSWFEQGVYKNFTQRVAGLRIPSSAMEQLPIWFPPEVGVWELVWGMIGLENLVVEEPLRNLLDRGAVIANDVYKLIWEARFLAKEHVNLTHTQRFVLSFTRWLSASLLTAEDEQRLRMCGVNRPISPEERPDALCFVLALAAQNGLFRHCMMLFDDLERAEAIHVPALREMFRFLLSVERWAALGPFPLGVLIGYTPSEESYSGLEQLEPRLAAKILQGLSWLKDRI